MGPVAGKRVIGAKLCIAVICPGLAAQGAVANVAIRQMTTFHPGIQIHFISDGTSEAAEQLGVVHVIEKPVYRYLGRLSHVFSEIGFARRAERCLRRIRAGGAHVDWVLTHGHVVGALAARQIQNTLRARVALVVHGDVFDRPRRMYGLALQSLYRWAAPRAYRRCNHVFTLSEHGRDLALAAGADPASTTILPNGVEPADIGLNRMPGGDVAARGAGDLRLLFVGRLSREKGVDVLLQACARLKERNVGYRLTVVGEGPEQRALEAMVDSLGLGGLVRFMGRVERRNLGAIYRAHDVVCMPSRLEAFPLVALEAMASGVTVMGARAGVLVDLLADRHGVPVHPNEPKHWCDALESLCREPGTLPELALKGQSRALHEYSWASVSAQLMGVLFPSQQVGQAG